MKNVSLLSLFLLLLTSALQAQFVIGKFADEHDHGLPEIQLELRTPENVFYTITDALGNFSFDVSSHIEADFLPSGCSVSDNYPNPFNPKTRIEVTLPEKKMIRGEIFNTLGEKIRDAGEKYFEAGINILEIELDGLPNGIYIARITIGGKYIVFRKLMLIYGSEHLSGKGNIGSSEQNYSFPVIQLDSLVSISPIIGRRVYTNLPVYTGGTLDLGVFTIIRHCPGTEYVFYEGVTYNTIMIGPLCWLKENLNAGTLIPNSAASTNNGILEKYCYGNSEAYCTSYGGLYRWDEAMAYSSVPGSQGICPNGWHVATLDDYALLIEAASLNANQLKQVGQGAGSGQGNNLTGFSGLLSGWIKDEGTFELMNQCAFLYTSSEFEPGSGQIYYFILTNHDESFNQGWVGKQFGMSIRCVKD